MTATWKPKLTERGLEEALAEHMLGLTMGQKADFLMRLIFEQEERPYALLTLLRDRVDEVEPLDQDDLARYKTWLDICRGKRKRYERSH